MSDLRIVYRLTNSQRMALCTFLQEYIIQMQRPGSNLSESSIDCSVVPNVETTPFELLTMFIEADELERAEARRVQ